MPFFKTTYNIIKAPSEKDELFESKWFESNKLVLPPGGPDDVKGHWDYNREMTIDDVDIWEQLYFESGGGGIYAAWLPYAEFYMIIPRGFYWRYDRSNIGIETYYGPMASQKVYERSLNLGMQIPINQVWVNDDELWLHKTS
jgi:hypothetical protein